MLQSDFVEGADDLTIEDIAKALSQTRSNWEGRVSAMHAFMNTCCAAGNKKKFDACMRPVKEHLLSQLGDRRSSVVRECCIVIAKISMVQTKLMTRWAPRMLEALFETMRINVEIMSISAHQSAKAVVKCVPENGKKLEITNALLAACKQPYIIVRQRAFEYITMLLNHSRLMSVKRTTQFWEKVMNAVKGGLQDPSTEVRVAAANALCELYLLNQRKVEAKLLVTLRPAQKTKFMKQLNQYQIQQRMHE